MEIPEDGGFMGALGTQLQDILVEWGEDPAEIAALDGQSLLTQFLALAQDRVPSADGPRMAVDQTPASLFAVVSSRVETPTDLLNKLLESSIAGASPAGTQGTAALSEMRCEDAGQPSSPTTIPADLLRRLLPPTLADGVDLPPTAAALAHSLESEETAPLAAIPADLLRRLLPPTPADGVDLPPTAAALTHSLESKVTASPTAIPADFLRRLLQSVPTPTDGVAAIPTTAVLADSGEPDQASILKTTAPTWLSQLFQGSTDGKVGTAQSGSPLAEEGQGLPTVFSTRGALLDLTMKATDETERLAVGDASDALAELPETGLPATGATSVGTQLGSGPARILDLSNVLRPGGETHLAEQVKWVMRSGLGTAELTLHPRSLGAMEVRVTMEADQAHVQFLSPHPIVREVLEAALPRLRDALAQDGLSLGNVSISEQAPERRGESDREQAGTAQDRQDFDVRLGDDIESPDIAGSTLSVLSGRLDYFI
ncbi:flagellar hook-length control protein FliK [Thiocystis minor]|uniref:flagellar hook-length control protein FliK n=1 Tax=Thiocystis minor TaxID=61597 RepID=UPI001914A2AD|nr:flagellar hook-length control protein FliK [Thiocystis minor]